jgi:hypothetical protein
LKKEHESEVLETPLIDISGISHIADAFTKISLKISGVSDTAHVASAVSQKTE